MFMVILLLLIYKNLAAQHKGIGSGLLKLQKKLLCK